MMKTAVDVVIIGGGPAGLSAALYTCRAGLSTVVFTRGGGALEKAEKIENYFGLDRALSGRELLANGLKQVRSLGASVVENEVLNLSMTDVLTVETAAGDYEAQAVILAAGSQRTAPKLDGLARFEGAGVSWCAVCDAFFYRGKTVGVLGAGDYALHEAGELLPVAGSVTLFTDGQPAPENRPADLAVNTEKLSSLYGEERLGGVETEIGEKIPLNGLFIAVGQAGSVDLARKLGVPVRDGSVLVDAQMKTAAPGVFAAGDCIGGIRQVSTAVGEGAAAGLSAIAYIRQKKQK